MPVSEDCPRGRIDCTVACNIISSNGESFICVGWNRLEDRKVKADRFTKCWKNAVIDERSHYDKRDLLDDMAVTAGALSYDENIRVNEDMTEEQMQNVAMKG